MRPAFVSAFVLALAALVSGGAPALAKDEKAEAKPALYVKDGDKYRPATEAELKAGAGHDEHAKGGGLEFTGIKRWDLGLYTLIVFGILMFVLSKYAWPHIKSGLEKREANIIGALEQAKKDRIDAETRLADAKKQLTEAAQQAGAVLAEARQQAEALKAAETEKGVKDAQAERDRATRDTEAKLEAMKKDLMHDVAELAALMASKALSRQVTLENQRELLDESIAELKVSANKA